SPYAMDAELTDARSEYHRLSPITYATQVRVPVLILQGDDDQRCPVGQAEELFTALIRHTDVPARLMRFPGGNHHVSTTGKPSHRVAYFRALVDWLQSHVQVRDRQAGGTGRVTRAVRSTGDAANDTGGQIEAAPAT